MPNKIKMRNGNAILIMVNDGEVIHFSPNMSLPHAEFVKRTAGQLPAPPEVADTVRRTFE